MWAPQPNKHLCWGSLSPGWGEQLHRLCPALLALLRALGSTHIRVQVVLGDAIPAQPQGEAAAVGTDFSPLFPAAPTP